jgi:hypothetical protein
MQRIRHHTIGEQAGEINAALRGHYAYYGVAGNLRSLVKVYRVVERYWRRMVVQPQLGRPPPHLGRLQSNQRTDTVAFCGNRGRVTASGDPVGVETELWPTH